MGLFKTKLIDRHVAEWQFEGFEILTENFGGLADNLKREIWLPVPEHFSDNRAALSGRELAVFVFQRVCEQYAYLDPKQFKLSVIDTPDHGFIDGGAVLNSSKQACGTYQYAHNGDAIEETITIDSELTKSPSHLIATIAHEMAHAVHSRTLTTLDVDPELYELFTDLTAIFFGYGVFLVNTRFDFQNNSQGWSAKGSGYLPEDDMLFALALFLKLNDISPERTREHLKPKLLKRFSKAMRQLDDYEAEIEELKMLKMAQVG